MKKLLILGLCIIGPMAMAQPGPDFSEDQRKEMKEKMMDLTPQQRASLKTKRMILDLDLTTSQQEKIQKVNEDFEVKMGSFRKDKEIDHELNKDELFALNSKRLDEEINQKNQLKSILTKDQLAKWEKIRSRHSKHEAHCKMKKSL